MIEKESQLLENFVKQNQVIVSTEILCNKIVNLFDVIYKTPKDKKKQSKC